MALNNAALMEPLKSAQPGSYKENLWVLFFFFGGEGEIYWADVVQKADCKYSPFKSAIFNRIDVPQMIFRFAIHGGGFFWGGQLLLGPLEDVSPRQLHGVPSQLSKKRWYTLTILAPRLCAVKLKITVLSGCRETSNEVSILRSFPSARGDASPTLQWNVILEFGFFSKAETIRVSSCPFKDEAVSGKTQE